MANIIVITNVLGDLSTNCYTVYNSETRDAFIVDPPSNAAFLTNMVKQQRFHLKAILLTHGHFDHTGAVAELKATFPEIEVYAAEAEKDVLANPGKNLSGMFGMPISLEADKYLQDGETISLIGTDVVCKLVPGHTEGGMCYYLPEGKMVFSGDTLFAGSIGRTDFPTGNGRQLLDKIQEQLFSLPDDTVVYSGHSERTTIGVEKTDNPFF